MLLVHDSSKLSNLGAPLTFFAANVRLRLSPVLASPLQERSWQPGTSEDQTGHDTSASTPSDGLKHFWEPERSARMSVSR